MIFILTFWTHRRFIDGNTHREGSIYHGLIKLDYCCCCILIFSKGRVFFPQKRSFPSTFPSRFFFSLKFYSHLYLSGIIIISEHFLETLMFLLVYIRLTFRRVSQEHNKEAEMRFVQWYLFRNMVRCSHKQERRGCPAFFILADFCTSREGQIEFVSFGFILCGCLSSSQNPNGI